MNNLIEITLDDGRTFFIESYERASDEDSAVVLASSKKTIVRKAKDYLTDSVDQIKAFASVLSNSILDSVWCPDEFELEFSVKFSADAGIIISKINTEANIGVKLIWKNNVEKLQ